MEVIEWRSSKYSRSRCSLAVLSWVVSVLLRSFLDKVGVQNNVATLATALLAIAAVLAVLSVLAILTILTIASVLSVLSIVAAAVAVTATVTLTGLEGSAERRATDLSGFGDDSQAHEGSHNSLDLHIEDVKCMKTFGISC